MEFKSDFLKIIQDRGFLNQITHPDKLDLLIKDTKITAYIGFDCTAKSLHIGSLIQIMVLRYLQKFGHTPIILLGGGTTKIGDPSGKDKSRQLIDNNKIAENINGIKKTLKRFDLSKDNPNLKPFKFINNDDWLKDLNYINFLREFGCHFSINRMLTFDSVKSRLDREQSLSFLEFNYMLLQAYDFYKLNHDYNCTLQIGGSDQWGNIVSGVELIKKINNIENKAVNPSAIFGLTTPLLTTSDGKKMGKTAEGALWLDNEMLDEFEYFQYFRNIDDKEVLRFIKLFTEIDLDKIDIIQEKDINEQKKILAFEVTKICHGEEIAKICLEKAQNIFDKNTYNIDSLPQILLEITHNDFNDGKSLVEILKENNLCSSNSEARRLIKGGGIKINDDKISDEFFLLRFNNYDKYLKLSIGKKKFFKIIWNKNFT